MSVPSGSSMFLQREIYGLHIVTEEHIQELEAFHAGKCSIKFDMGATSLYCEDIIMRAPHGGCTISYPLFLCLKLHLL